MGLTLQPPFTTVIGNSQGRRPRLRTRRDSLKTVVYAIAVGDLWNHLADDFQCRRDLAVDVLFR
jgi:hypothetical protein